MDRLNSGYIVSRQEAETEVSLRVADLTWITGGDTVFRTKVSPQDRPCWETECSGVFLIGSFPFLPEPAQTFLLIFTGRSWWPGSRKWLEKVWDLVWLGPLEILTLKLVHLQPSTNQLKVLTLAPGYLHMDCNSVPLWFVVVIFFVLCLLFHMEGCHFCDSV